MSSVEQKPQTNPGILVRSHLMWLRGFMESVAPDAVPKVDMALGRLDELVEQLEALQRAIVNSGCKAQVDEALNARYYQAPNPAIRPEVSERDRSGDETLTTQVSPSAYLPGNVGGDDQASRSETPDPASEPEADDGSR